MTGRRKAKHTHPNHRLIRWLPSNILMKTNDKYWKEHAHSEIVCVYEFLNVFDARWQKQKSKYMAHE